MTIAWASFTPISAFLGGCLIGLAALLLMVFQGRVMGVSGIIGGFVRNHITGRAWLAIGVFTRCCGWPDYVADHYYGTDHLAGGCQRAAILYRSFFSWAWHGDRVGLYIGSWHLRPCPIFVAVIDCGDDLHDKRGGDCCHRQSFLAAGDRS
jgi:hypothetical protein